MRNMFFAAAAAALCVAAMPAAAAVKSVEVSGSTFVSGPGGGFASLNALGVKSVSGDAAGSVAAVGKPAPYVLATATGGGGASSSAGSNVTMKYYFAFGTADADLAAVLDHQIDIWLTNPVDFRLPTIGVKGSVFLDSPFEAQAGAHIDAGVHTDEYAQFTCASYDRSGCGWTDFSILAPILGGAVVDGVHYYGGSISMFAGADVFEGGPTVDGKTALAFLDPQLFFDGHPEITFDLSEGLANATSGHVLPVGGGMSAAPEPAGWALMIAGFGLTGGAVRARRRRLA